MAPGHLVANPYLALLGDIYLGKPDNTCGKLITDGNVVPPPLIDTVNLLVLDHIVVKKLLNAVILLLVSGPLVGIDVHVINLLELLEGELCTLGDNVYIEIILYSL